MLKLLSALFVVFGTQTAFAADCPVDFGTSADYMGDVVAAVAKEKSCYASAAVAESCAMGSSMDSVIAGTASEVCERDFAAKLSKADNSTYSSLTTKCFEKYEKMQGTMYISAAAFCRLSVAQLYSNLYTPAE